MVLQATPMVEYHKETVPILALRGIEESTFHYLKKMDEGITDILQKLLYESQDLLIDKAKRENLKKFYAITYDKRVLYFNSIVIC